MLVATDVLLGEGRLVVPAQHGVSGVALVQHGLQLALVVAVDASPEEMGRPIRAADQHTQFAGALEERSERCGAFEHDVGGQLHLGHAVAVARSQRRTFVWTEDRAPLGAPSSCSAVRAVPHSSDRLQPAERPHR